MEAERALRGFRKDEEAFEIYIGEYKNPRYARLLEETAAAIEQVAEECGKQKSALVEVRTAYLKNHPQRDFSASAEDNSDYQKLLSQLQCGELEDYKKRPEPRRNPRWSILKKTLSTRFEAPSGRPMCAGTS